MTDAPLPAAPFPKTPWSLVARARDNRDAFGRLLAEYREPLLEFARAKLRTTPHDAEDAVGELYAAMLAKDSPLQQVHPAQGKFRSWLATCLQNEVMQTWRKAAAEKRGGGAVKVALDAEREGAPLEVVNEMDDPAAAFDRAFAQTLYRRVLAQFLVEAGDGTTLEARVRRVAFEGEGASEQELMAAFNVSRATVTRAKRAARDRFRAMIELALTELVETPEELAEEVQWLLRSAV